MPDVRNHRATRRINVAFAARIPQVDTVGSRNTRATTDSLIKKVTVAHMSRVISCYQSQRRLAVIPGNSKRIPLCSSVHRRDDVLFDARTLQ